MLKPARISAMREFASRESLIALLVGFVLGLLVFGLVRFATYSPEHTHYHANFAVYVNGERQQFDGLQYYEDVAVCSAYEEMKPKERVHMHNQVNDSVHVHDEGVTWGAYFQNLGWAIDGDFIKTDSALLVENDDNDVTFILNGQDQPDITNMLIGNEDRLLISYGKYDADTAKAQFDTIKATAAKHNQTQDPASCSGSQAPTMKDRFRHIFDRG